MKVLLLLICLLSINVYSETESTDEADQVITNRRMRASEGSLSKFSVNTFWNYSGGSIDDPFEPVRPNIVRGGNVQTLHALSGEVGVRYRITKLDSITASTGLFMTTPLHSKIDDNSPGKKAFDENARKLNVQDPFLRYSHLDILWGFQASTTVTAKKITNNQLSNLGYEGEYNLSLNLMKDLEKTGFSYGVLFSGFFYDHNKEKADQNKNITTRTLGIYPQAEYVINDTFNLRTLFGWQIFEHFRGNRNSQYTKRKVYQSVGLGISLSRDVFLYPNIQYIPSNARGDVTNIAMSANINLF